MKTRLKRLLSGVLALAMVFSLMPTSSMVAYAVESLVTLDKDTLSDGPITATVASTFGDCMAVVSNVNPVIIKAESGYKLTKIEFTSGVPYGFRFTTEYIRATPGNVTLTSGKATVANIESDTLTISSKDTACFSIDSITVYYEEDAPQHVHDWGDEDGVCTVCGYECTHDWSNEDGQCSICWMNCPHTEGIEDGKCKTCGADCKHNNWEPWITDPAYHTRYCSDCHKEDTNFHSWENSVCTVCSYGCPHESYNYDGKCTQCGKPCPHTNLTWEYDDKSHTGVCAACGVYEVSGDHEFVDGDCICGYENPHKATTTYGKDGTNHWFTCAVQGCTEHKFKETAHQLVEGACVCGVVCTHQWNSETGICNVCSMECPHFSYNENYACANCGKPCTHPVYNMVLGACQTCRKPCTHSWNATTGKCDVCAMSCKHDFDADHICTICGAKARIYMEDDTLYVLADGVNPNDYGQFSNSIKHIVFAEGVSSISYFGSMQNLETVTFSSTIRRINSSAFSYCYKLKKVSLNEGLETIPFDAFFGCSSLTDINFPSTLKTIKEYAFSDCSSLTDVTFPAALTSIGASAFQYCTSLKNVVIEHGVFVDHNTFGSCTGLESITFCNDPAQTTTIQGQPFYSCSSLKEVVLGASVKTIPGGMFYGCSNIEKLVIGNKDVVLNGSSFYNVGSQAKPATLILPEDWERDVPVEGQQWNSGWFVLACNHTNMTWNTDLYSHVGTCEDCGEYEVSGDHVYVDGVCVCGFEQAFADYLVNAAATVEAMAGEDDSQAVSDLIDAALEAIFAVEFDSTKSDEENQAVIDDIIAQLTSDIAAQKAAEELAERTEAYEDFKTDAIDTIEAMRTPDDSETVTNLIDNAEQEVENAEFDAEMTDEENQAVINNIINQLINDLKAQNVVCVSAKTVSVQNGTFHLALGGKLVGEYTFEAVSGGWAIKDETGYLTIVNGKLTHTDAPAAWEYKNGGFSMSFKTTTTVLLFFKTTKTTTYYLSGADSVSTSTVKAVLTETITANAHTFGALVNLKNGTHKHTCSACGEVETLNCVYDNDTHVCECGAYDPAFVNVKIDAVVEKVTSRYLLFFTRTTYRATITTAAEGTTVKKVEYSTNDGKSWKSGTSFTSSSAIEKFKVRVTDANGTVYNYTYPDDAVMVEVVE